MTRILFALAGIIIVYIVPVAIVWVYVLSNLAAALP